MPLTTFSANSTARAAEVNANFALCVLTDTARTITVTHTFSARQTMAGIDSSANIEITVNSTSTFSGTDQTTFNRLYLLSNDTDATGRNALISFGNATAAEMLIGYVQNASGYADTVFVGYDGTYHENARLTAAGVLTVKAGVTVTAGGLTVTAGGLTVTAGGLTVSAGTTSLQATTVASRLTMNGVSADVIKITSGANGTEGASAYIQWFRANGSTGRGYLGFDTNDSPNMVLTNQQSGTLVLKTADTTAITISAAQVSTFAGLVATPASVAGSAGLRLPHGTAPTSPVNGDIWTTTAGLFVRINGATVGPLS